MAFLSTCARVCPGRALAYLCRRILNLSPGLIELTAQGGSLRRRLTFYDVVYRISMPHFVKYRTFGRNASPESGVRAMTEALKERKGFRQLLPEIVGYPASETVQSLTAATSPEDDIWPSEECRFVRMKSHCKTRADATTETAGETI